MLCVRSSSAADVCASEIRPLNDRLIAAFNQRDTAALMGFYVPDKSLVVFDDTSMMLTGPDEVRTNFEEAFKTTTRLHAEIRTFQCVAHPDMALAIYFLPTQWADATGDHEQTTRYTQVLVKRNGKWLIQHDHLSVPYDPLTGKIER